MYSTVTTVYPLSVACYHAMSCLEITHDGSQNHTKHDLAVEATDSISAGVSHLLAVRWMFPETQLLLSFYKEGITFYPASSISAQACFRPACHPAAALGCSQAAELALLASSARSHRRCSARYEERPRTTGPASESTPMKEISLENPASISTGIRCHVVPQLPSCLSGCNIQIGTRY